MRYRGPPAGGANEPVHQYDHHPRAARMASADMVFFYVYITLYVLGKIALFVIEMFGYTVVFTEPPQMFLCLWELSSHWLPPNSNPATAQ